GDLHFGAARIHETLEESQALIAGGHAGEVPGGGVTGTAFAGSVEILLALVDIAGGKILRVDALSSSGLRFRDVLPGVDEGGQPRELLVRHREARHRVAPIANHGPDL